MITTEYILTEFYAKSCHENCQYNHRYMCSFFFQSFFFALVTMVTNTGLNVITLNSLDPNNAQKFDMPMLGSNNKNNPRSINNSMTVSVCC